MALGGAGIKYVDLGVHAGGLRQCEVRVTCDV